MKKPLFHLLLLILIFVSFSFSTTNAFQQVVDCDEPALREALSTGGTIQLAAGCVYLLTQNPPHIQADIVIEGNGAVIDGQGTYRLLSSLGRTNITIRHLTLKNGAYGEGGALYVRRGTVTIEDSTFENNKALFGSGGAIWVQQGTITVTNSQFLNNSAYDRGGAVWTGTGDVSIIDSLFMANQAAAGGGVYSQDGTVTITSSSFIGNAAQVGTDRSLSYRGGIGGGAIFTQNQDVIITNSTFADNSAITGSGKGAYTVGQGGAVHAVRGNIVITSSTLTRNAAFIGGAVYAQEGVIRSEQSIIANNQAEQQGADIPIDSRFESQGYNLIGDDGGGRLTVAETDLVNVDPGLIESGDHLFELAPNSPAYDAILSEKCASTQDQRGVLRPQGSGCDIGALEKELVGLVQASPTPTPISTLIPGNEITCTEDHLRSALTAGGEWNLPAGCHIVLTGSLPAITNDLVLHGNSSFIDGAGQFRLLYAPSTANITVNNLTLQNAHGSALWAARGTVTVTDSALIDNSTDEIGGGAMYVYNGDVTLTNSAFEDNTAVQSGGGVWAARGRLSSTLHILTIASLDVFRLGKTAWVTFPIS